MGLFTPKDVNITIKVRGIPYPKLPRDVNKMEGKELFNITGLRFFALFRIGIRVGIDYAAMDNISEPSYQVYSDTDSNPFFTLLSLSPLGSLFNSFGCTHTQADGGQAEKAKCFLLIKRTATRNFFSILVF
jgi:hypothetical protein